MIIFPHPKKLTRDKGFCSQGLDALETHTDPGLPVEGYRLEITPRSVRLTSGGPAGEFYGRKTLAQIGAQSGEEGLPCLYIEDEPDFGERAYMLDVSRCKVPTLDTLKALVVLMSDFKLNQLQLYTEHTFAYAGHELVWGDSSPLTPQDIVALDAWCREHFVELVPNQNSFGHLGRWLRHPEYFGYAECPDGFIHPHSGNKTPHGTTLRPNEASLALLSELFAELLPCFTSNKFNIGCDETWELGQGWSKPLADAEGVGRVYLRFLQNVCTMVQSGGREVQYWADGLVKHPELLAEAPEGACPVVWGYEAAYPFDAECRLMADADLAFYVAPGDSTWNSFTGRLVNARYNIESAARHGLRYGARGLIQTHWGDNGHAQTWAVMLPGLLMAASAAWHNASGMEGLEGALNCFVFEDSENRLAQALLKLGEIDTLLPAYRGNRSMLFDSIINEAGVTLSSDEAAGAQSLLAEVAALLDEARPACQDADWILAEARLAHRMTHWALERALGMSGERLRPALQCMIGDYENIWLRRNCVGGLYESSTRLRKAWQGL